MNEWTPALVFFRLWKWGLVNVFIAASNPTLLILLVKDTGLLSLSIFNPQSQNPILKPQFAGLFSSEPPPQSNPLYQS